MRTALPLLILAVSGCDAFNPTTCTHEAVPGLVVEVRDAETGRYIAAGAVAVAQEEAYADTLVEYAFSDGGALRSLAGAYERPGSYGLTVSRVGYRTWRRENVRVTGGECHVRPIELEALLERE